MTHQRVDSTVIPEPGLNALEWHEFVVIAAKMNYDRQADQSRTDKTPQPAELLPPVLSFRDNFLSGDRYYKTFVPLLKQQPRVL